MSYAYTVTLAYALMCVSARLAFARRIYDDSTMNVFRLPCNTRPESYDLLIAPKLDGTESTFDGVTKIVLLPNERTDYITLNVKDLCVVKVTLEEIADQASKNLKVRGFQYVKNNQQLVIYLQGYMEPERRHLVTIEYTGRMSLKLSAFFLASHHEGDTVKWSAATRLIFTFAREVFPCYDEPHYKALFNVSMIKPKDYVALSNMPIMKIEDLKNGEEDQEIVSFESTPLLPTYVIAFFVGQCVSSQNVSGMTIYTYGDYVKQTDYMSNEAPKLFQAMVDYTAVSIPLQKIDLVDVEFDDLDGIQNYGLHFFGEENLYITDDSSTKSKIDAILTVQQRFIYYWFGNLVTVAWWNHLWMQIGFHHYLKYFILGIAEPDWPVEEWYFYEIQICTFLTDSPGIGPMAASVETPEDVLAVAKSYPVFYKAAAVLRMLRYIVSEKLFQLSVQHYLNTFKFGVAVPEDLYSCFDKVLSDNQYEVGGFTVTEFMSNWTLQEGYPLLNIKRDLDTNTFIIIQTQYPPSNGNGSLAWIVDLTFTTQQSKNFDYNTPTFWTDRNSKTTTIPAPNDSGWYIFNIQASSLYRVNYDLENWKALINQLNKDVNVIPILNRASLLSDSFSLAIEGILSYSVPLCLSTYLKNEEKPLAWYYAIGYFEQILNGIPRDEKAYTKIKTYAAELFGVVHTKFEDLAANGCTDVDILKALDVLGTYACSLGNENCRKKALDWFDKWQSGQKIPPDVKDVALCVGLNEYDDQATFDKIYELFITSTSISEKEAASKALGCSSNATLLSACVQKLILERPEISFKKKEYELFINNVVGKEKFVGFDVLIDFLINNLNTILNEVIDAENLVVFMYETLSDYAINDDQMDKLKRFKDDAKLPPSIKEQLEPFFAGASDYLSWATKNYETFKMLNDWNVESCTE